MHEKLEPSSRPDKVDKVGASAIDNAPMRTAQLVAIGGGKIEANKTAASNLREDNKEEDCVSINAGLGVRRQCCDNDNDIDDDAAATTITGADTLTSLFAHVDKGKSQTQIRRSF